MLKQVALILTMSCAVAAHAYPVTTFISAQFETSAVAVAGSQANVQFGSSPPAALPLITTASVVGASNFSSASAIAAPGLLTAQAEASAITGVANAVGSTEYISSFFEERTYTSLHLVFGSQNATSSGFSAASLFVLITAGNTTYLNQALTSPGVFDLTVAIPLGSLVNVDVLLSSEASFTNGGNAFNFASLSYEVRSLPEPATPVLIAAALALVAAVTRRRIGRSGV